MISKKNNGKTNLDNNTMKELLLEHNKNNSKKWNKPLLKNNKTFPNQSSKPLILSKDSLLYVLILWVLIDRSLKRKEVILEE